MEWQLINPTEIELAPRIWTLVVPLDDKKVLIMGGYGGGYRNDITILNTNGDTCEPQVENHDGFKFVAYYNPIAITTDNTVVAFVYGNDRHFHLIKWTKDDEEVTSLKDYGYIFD